MCPERQPSFSDISYMSNVATIQCFITRTQLSAHYRWCGVFLFLLDIIMIYCRFITPLTSIATKPKAFLEPSKGYMKSFQRSAVEQKLKISSSYLTFVLQQTTRQHLQTLCMKDFSLRTSFSLLRYLCAILSFQCLMSYLVQITKENVLGFKLTFGDHSLKS